MCHSCCPMDCGAATLTFMVSMGVAAESSTTPSGKIRYISQVRVFHFLTLSFVFERLADLVGHVAAVIIAALQRFVEAVGHAGRQLQAAAPTCRLRTRPSHQVLHPHHHLPGHCQDFILNTQRICFTIRLSFIQKVFE